ncbi:bypass of stop codon protein 1 [Saccharomyces cerevisiae RM11-1a]|uniref:Bypass of stop codon protein 1 n=1 Tax=Saccharomyces cerevisiae (strain RM11-1a) TaxID=285006 RepID=B3LGT8_YEAS1|nr:bypass of stop codon protein 1 [Saccharomyces cerevisiae RM11-1a]
MLTLLLTVAQFGCQISKSSSNIYKVMLLSTGKLGNGGQPPSIYRQVVTIMTIKATHKRISLDFIGPTSARETMMALVQKPRLHPLLLHPLLLHPLLLHPLLLHPLLLHPLLLHPLLLHPLLLHPLLLHPLLLHPLLLHPLRKLPLLRHLL